MDALILCGGFATRLEPITLFVPKPLLPVGGRPILDYIVDNVLSVGAERIVISTNKKFADQFEYWANSRRSQGLTKPLELIVEPALHNGQKFGAIKGIEYAIEKAHLDDDLIIVSGDNLFSFSLSGLMEHFHRTRQATVCVYDVGSIDDAKRFGVIKLEGSSVTDFVEKPEHPESTLISTGIYAFPKEMLNKFRAYILKKNNPDAPGYFLQWYIKGMPLHAVVYKGDWFDIGTIDTYKKVFDHFIIGR